MFATMKNLGLLASYSSIVGVNNSKYLTLKNLYSLSNIFKANLTCLGFNQSNYGSA